MIFAGDWRPAGVLAIGLTGDVALPGTKLQEHAGTVRGGMPPTADGVSVDVLRSIDAFIELGREWSDLFAHAANPVSYLAHTWLRLSWQLSRRAKTSALRVIAVRDGGQLVMAGAFVLTTRDEEPIVRFLASGTPQSEDVLWRKSERTSEHADLLLAALRAEKGEHRRLRTQRVPEESVFRAAVMRAGLRVRLLKKADYFFVPLQDHRDFAAYLSALSPNLRHDHRRQMRRLEERGGFQFTLESGEQAGEALGWLFDRKRAWLAEQNMPLASFKNNRIDRFVASFIEGEGPSKHGVATLRVQGAIIAASLFYLERDAVNFRVLAHDPAFAVNSPGRCLTMLVIAEAFARGSQEFAFGTGGMEWKDRLKPKRTFLLSERIRL
jgi:CelD/BcsL family acetyltransferase involved in cellulose biosynthesis